MNDILNNFTSIVRKGVDEYRMIDDGDAVAVGVSGGKDSLLLLCALRHLQQFYPKQFSLRAITVELGFPGMDFAPVAELCRRIGVPYTRIPTDIREVVFDVRREPNPCALCAKMRRAVLAKLCQEYGCNKLALGHHREDVIETLLMSLFYEGRFHTFHPKTLMSRTGITVIRPLVYLPESHVKHMLKVLDLPLVASPCPVNGETKRQEMKELLNRLHRIYPDAEERFLHALQQDRYDLWQKEE